MNAQSIGRTARDKDAPASSLFCSVPLVPPVVSVKDSSESEPDPNLPNRATAVITTTTTAIVLREVRELVQAEQLAPVEEFADST